MPCPFCVIDFSRTQVLEEREHTFVALSNPRLVPGHLLVVPRRHIEQIVWLSRLEILECFSLLSTYEARIIYYLGASGCDIRQHFRPFLPESDLKVNHLHFHLLPRNFGDELYQKSQRYEREIFKPLEEAERKRIAEMVCARMMRTR